MFALQGQLREMWLTGDVTEELEIHLANFSVMFELSFVFREARG